MNDFIGPPEKPIPWEVTHDIETTRVLKIMDKKDD